MKKLLKRRPLRGSRRLFAQDRRGTAALEFAIVAPMLIVSLYFPAISSYEGVRASRSVNYASTTVADLLSRQSVLTEEARDRMFTTAGVLMSNADEVQKLVITVASVSNPVGGPEDEAPVLDWSYSNEDEYAFEEGDIESIDLPVIADGDSVIIARVSALYKPRFVPKGLAELTLEETAFRRPRFVLRIADNIGN